MVSESRPGDTQQGKALAEAALACLAAAAGSRSSELVLIGGLVPEHLVSPDAAPHRGTIDVDLLVNAPPAYDGDDHDFAWLESAVYNAGFQDPRGDGWRWQANVDGATVTVEFLCDVGTERPEAAIALPGTHRLSAWNLSGSAAALEAPEPLGDPRSPQALVLRAGLGGFLLAKTAAAASRAMPKDHYDIAYVLINVPGGPAKAGESIRAVLNSPRLRRSEHWHRQNLAFVLQRFILGDRPAAQDFADEAARGANASRPRRLEEATSAAAALAQALDIHA